MSDPHYLREAEKYESPIPSREHILSFIQKRVVYIQKIQGFFFIALGLGLLLNLII